MIMENKINVAELLKDCPKGMELDCTMYEDVYFDYIHELNTIYCYIKDEGFKTTVVFNQFGTPNSNIKSKCVIFPKGKTTWEGFCIPFKDGDIVVTTLGNIAIIRKSIEENLFCIYGFMVHDIFYKDEAIKVVVERLATEEEKQKLFDAIKATGYRWNPETKTLEKLIEPKFKVGDKIEKLGSRFTITEIKDNYYLTKCGNKILIDNQDDFNLISNKFDITALTPFDKVLVRDHNDCIWRADFYSHYEQNQQYWFVCVGDVYKQCIPYNEETANLLSTDHDCPDKYKTWKK